jgi:hypothetical protein
MNIKGVESEFIQTTELVSFLNTSPDLHFSFADSCSLRRGIEQLSGDVVVQPTGVACAIPRMDSSVTLLRPKSGKRLR